MKENDQGAATDGRTKDTGIIKCNWHSALDTAKGVSPKAGENPKDLQLVHGAKAALTSGF